MIRLKVHWPSKIRDIINMTSFFFSYTISCFKKFYEFFLQGLIKLVVLVTIYFVKNISARYFKSKFLFFVFDVNKPGQIVSIIKTKLSTIITCIQLIT